MILDRVMAVVLLFGIAALVLISLVLVLCVLAIQRLEVEPLQREVDALLCCI